jgi:hypothetical protein
MKPTTWMYIGAGILILVSLCFLGYGGLNVVGSFDQATGSSSWLPLGIGLMCVGLLMIAGGVVLIVVAARKTKQETVQNVTLNLDLPAETKFSQVKCQSCGGTLSAENVTIVNGAPMVNCPYCHTIYQMTEEPKW